MGKHIVIIGSGFGSLGAACRLAAHGHQVEVFEKRDKLGGRGYVYEINGFKFDGGPTVVTAPFMFDDIFKLAGKNREDYFKMVPVNPFYRIFDHQQRHFDYNNDPQFIYEEIRKWNPEDVENYKRFIHSTKNIFYKGFIELADEPFSKVAGMSRVAPDLIRLKSYQIFYRYVASFIKNDFLRQVFSFHPLLVGGNPFDSSSIYAMIHYLEREWGVHFAVGGTGAIVDGLVKLLNDLGGRLHLDSEVAQILVKNGAASGVRLMDGNEVSADIVISNADSSSTYKYLFPPENRKKYTDRRLANLRYSMSLFVIYFGTKRRYTDSALAHHNIILSKRYKDLLNDIFNKKILADDFSLYLHMPTLTDPSLAPEGHEAFYVLSPVPNLEADIDYGKTIPGSHHAISGRQLPARFAGQYRRRAYDRPPTLQGHTEQL